LSQDIAGQKTQKGLSMKNLPNNPRKPIVTFKEKKFPDGICYLSHIWCRQDGAERAIVIVFPTKESAPFTVDCDVSQLDDYYRYR